MAVRDRHYFVYGNTAQGFVNKLPSNLHGLDKLFIIRGAPGTGKACLMKFIAAECEKTDYFIEYLHCPSAPDTYDGIIIPEKKLAVIDGTDLHYTKLITSDPAARYIDTDLIFEGGNLDSLHEKVSYLIAEIGICHEKAFECFQEALRVHDEWEKIYIENMDFLKADSLGADVSALILKDTRFDKTPVSKVRFFGGSTPSGAMDYIENLTGSVSKRYLLKGRPGTGKSTLLKKLATASNDRGINTEVYHCAFDSNSLDMLIWPELDVCLFDSTAPHLYAPSRSNDEIIDMYTACVKPGTDEKYEKELEDITARYKDAVARGTQHLSAAKDLLDELNLTYAMAADPGEVFSLCDEVTDALR